MRMDGSGNGTLNLPDGTKAEFKFDKDGNITQIAIEQPDIALAPGWWEGKTNEEIISLLQDLLQQGYLDTVAEALRELITGVVIEEGGKVRVIPGDLERAKTIANQLEGVTIIDMPGDTHYVRIVGQRIKTSQGQGVVVYAKDGLAITKLDNGRIMFEGKSTLGGSFNVSFRDWKQFTQAIINWQDRLTPQQFADLIAFSLPQLSPEDRKEIIVDLFNNHSLDETTLIFLLKKEEILETLFSGKNTITFGRSEKVIDDLNLEIKGRIFSILSENISDSTLDLETRGLSVDLLTHLAYGKSSNFKDQVRIEEKEALIDPLLNFLVEIKRDHSSDVKEVKVSILKLLGELGNDQISSLLKEKMIPYMLDIINDRSQDYTVRVRSTVSLIGIIKDKNVNIEKKEGLIEPLIDLLKDSVSNNYYEKLNIASVLTLLVTDSNISNAKKNEITNSFISILNDPQMNAGTLRAAGRAIHNIIENANVDSSLKQELPQKLMDILRNTQNKVVAREAAVDALIACYEEGLLNTAQKGELIPLLTNFLKEIKNLPCPPEDQLGGEEYYRWAIDFSVELLTYLSTDSDLDYSQRAGIIDSLLNFLRDPQACDDLKGAIAFYLNRVVSSNLTDKSQKEKIMDTLAEVVTGDSIERVKYNALNTLSMLVEDPEIDISKKEALISPFIDILSNPNEDRDVKGMIVGKIFLPLAKMSEVSAQKKIEMVESLKNFLQDENMRDWWRMYAAIALGYIVSDSQVNRTEPSLREEIFVFLEEMYNREENRPIDFQAKNYDTLRGIAIAMVTIAREDENYKQRVASFFNLSGQQLAIWNKYEILVIKGTNEFSEADLSLISNLLDSLPSHLLEGVKVIVNYLWAIRSMGTAGFTDGEGGIGMFFTSERNLDPTLPPTGMTLPQFFIDVLYHEIGHTIDFDILTPDQRKEFDRLNKLSGNNPQNYARLYGMYNRWEDFATMFEAYTYDTIALLIRAKVQAEDNDPTNDILLEKVKFFAKLFAHEGEDGKMYTYIYKIEEDGTIKRAEVELGGDGLPVIPDNINWETF